MSPDHHSFRVYSCFFFFNDTATTEIYTLSLHDALPISRANPLNRPTPYRADRVPFSRGNPSSSRFRSSRKGRSEEHTSELQSPCNLVCRLLLEKKKNHSDRLIDVHRHEKTIRHDRQLHN